MANIFFFIIKIVWFVILGLACFLLAGLLKSYTGIVKIDDFVLFIVYPFCILICNIEWDLVECAMYEVEHE